MILTIKARILFLWIQLGDRVKWVLKMLIKLTWLEIIWIVILCLIQCWIIRCTTHLLGKCMRSIIIRQLTTLPKNHSDCNKNRKNWLIKIFMISTHVVTPRRTSESPGKWSKKTNKNPTSPPTGWVLAMPWSTIKTSGKRYKTITGDMPPPWTVAIPPLAAGASFQAWPQRTQTA